MVQSRATRLIFPDTQSSWYWLMALVVALAFVWRVLTIGESLWLDEIHTSWVVSDDYSQIMARAAEGNQAPLYFWLVGIVTRLVGHSELTLRVVSLAAGTIAVGACATLVRQWTQSNALAILTAVLAAIDPHFIFYAREARPYALLQVLAVVHLFLADQRQAESDRHVTPCWPPSRVRWWWIASTWLLFYTHFTSMLLIPAELVASLAVARRGRWRSLFRAWCVDLAVVATGCLVLSNQLRYVFERRNNWRQFVDVEPLLRVLTVFPTEVYIGCPLVLVAVVALFRRYAFSEIGNARPERCAAIAVDSVRYRTLLLSSTFLIPILIAWFSTYRTPTYPGLAPLFFRRYLMVATVPLVALPGWIGTWMMRERDRVIYSVLCVVMACVCYSRKPTALWTVHSREDWPAVVEHVDRETEALSWPLVMRSGIIEDDSLGPNAGSELREYCTFPLTSLYQFHRHSGPLITLPSRRELNANDLLPQQRARILSSPGLWIVSRGAPEKARAFVERLADMLERIGCSADVTSHDGVAGVSLVQLRLVRQPQRRDRQVDQ